MRVAVVEIPETSAGERRLARMIESVAPGGWDWNARTRTLLISPRLRQIFGFPESSKIDLGSLVSAIHPEDRSWTALFDGDAVPSSNDQTVVRYRIERADTGAVRWIVSHIRRNPTTPDQPSGYSGTVEDVTEEIETAQALIESEERLRLAIEAGKMAVWELDLETGDLTYSPELNRLWGLPSEARPNLSVMRTLYAPGELERLAQEGATAEAVRERAVGGAFEPWRRGGPQPTGDRTQVQAEVAIVTPAGVPKSLLLRAQYAPFTDGRPRLTGLLVDITEKKLAEQRLALVARELQHRVKNSLSVVRAIAAQSLRIERDLEGARDAFLGRIGALATATDLLFEQSSETVDLHRLVDQITNPYRGGNSDPFDVAGPIVAVPSKMATSLSMALHELSTNALKYGALSAPGGRVHISWDRDGDALVLTWEETGGPPVSAPNRQGFGSKLLEKVLPGDMGGKIDLQFNASGVRCVLRAHLN